MVWVGGGGVYRWWWGILVFSLICTLPLLVHTPPPHPPPYPPQITHPTPTLTPHRYGNHVFIHFQAMEFSTVSKLVAQYQPELPCFSDELHGAAAVVLAGVLGALPSMKGPLGEQTIIISGVWWWWWCG